MKFASPQDRRKKVEEIVGEFFGRGIERDAVAFAVFSVVERGNKKQRNLRYLQKLIRKCQNEKMKNVCRAVYDLYSGIYQHQEV